MFVVLCLTCRFACLHRQLRASQQAFSAGCAGIIYTRLSILRVVRKCNVMYFDTKLTIFSKH